jgi:hypothetical protein
MRTAGAIVCALAGLALFASPAAASVSATISPTSVDFGRVVYNGGCQIDANDQPNAACVTRTLTVTNTGTEALEGLGAGACETLILPQNSCITVHAGWGGFTGHGTSTCIFGVVAPGETCTVVLVASPTRKGQIRGFFEIELYSRASDQTIILAVPVRLLSVPK